MIEDSGKKQFQYVLVYQLDRFVRNRYNSAINKAKLKKNGVRVLSARENITDDASGALIEGVLESMAEYYSKELSQKVKRGLNINAQKRLATGGYIAPGYKVGEDRKYIIDEETAPVVKEIFELYAGGKKVEEILGYLESRQMKSVRGNSYNKSSLLRWLRNKNYIGVYTFKDIEVPDGMPRIVSDELFEQVQRRLGKNKASPARAKAKEEYILTTKLFCGKCRDMMVGISGTGKLGKIYHYYSCNNYRRKKCRMTNKPKRLYEDAVVMCAKDQLTDENIERLATRIEEVCNKDKHTDRIKRLQKLLKENEKQRANLIAALRVHGASEDTTKTIYEELTKLEEAHALIEKDIADESLVRVNMTKAKIVAFFNSLKDGDVNDPVYRKALINIFVNRVYAYKKWLSFTFNTQDKPIELDAEFLDKLEAELSAQAEGLYLEPSVPPKTPMHALKQSMHGGLFCP